MEFDGGYNNMEGEEEIMSFDACYSNGIQDFDQFHDPLDVLMDGCTSNFDEFLHHEYHVLGVSSGGGYEHDYPDHGCMQQELGHDPLTPQSIKPLMALAPPDELSSVTGDNGFLGPIRTGVNRKSLPVKKSGGKIYKKPNVVKGQWTMDEDRMLMSLVEQHGLRKWSQIAQMLHGRIGKQCRDRWHNHLRPNIKKDSWTEEEDRILIKAHSEIGNKWSEIGKILPGRTENSIKNHWNATKRRQFSRRCRNSKHPRSSSLLENYIKSLAVKPPSVAAALVTGDTKSSTPSTDGDSKLQLYLPSKMHTATTNAWDFSNMPNLLLVEKKVSLPNMDFLSDQLGCNTGAGCVDQGFGMDINAWDVEPLLMPFENMKREMDLMEMISRNSNNIDFEMHTLLPL